MSKNLIVPVKNFVVNHRTALAVGVTVIAMAALNKRTAGIYNDFLAENNLLETFNAQFVED